jgi:hypothetical protein
VNVDRTTRFARSTGSWPIDNSVLCIDKHPYATDKSPLSIDKASFLAGQEACLIDEEAGSIDRPSFAPRIGASYTVRDSS